MTRPLNSRPVGSSATTTITLENPSQQCQEPQALVLRLSRRPSTKKVTWKEGTVDNEFLQKKSSKKCCIFHKQKAFDEDNSDDENVDHNHETSKSKKDAHGPCGGSCSNDSEASTSCSHSGAE